MKKAKWIWNYGDFELYHSMLLMNRRTVHGEFYATGFRVEQPKCNLTLTKTAVLDKEETVEFYCHADLKNIYVSGGTWDPSINKYRLAPGEHTITVNLFKNGGFPSFYADGDTFASDETWTCKYDKSIIPVGTNDMYTSPNDDPEIFKFSYKRIYPVSFEKVNDGTIYDFGCEYFGNIIAENVMPQNADISFYCGESYEEALNYKDSIVNIFGNAQNGYFKSISSAFRYIFVPDGNTTFDISADYEYLPIEDKGSFECDDELINKIWNVASYTLHLNTREGYFDGLKRDRWIWSGDAYQSYKVNYYLTNDNDIVRRTTLMLRGADPVTQHINTIPDYTFYWIMGIWEYYFYSGDKQFVENIYSKMLSTMKFVRERLDNDGLYTHREPDWIFLDWSTFDEKSGPMCAEQILLCKAYEYMSRCSGLVGDKKSEAEYKQLCNDVKQKVISLYWDDEKCAFVDDYKTGNRNVTRHANIFALLYDIVDDDKKQKIIKNVIKNKEITPITTPYFEYYELDAMCAIGEFEYMTDMLRDYWGGMIKLGATTFWEEYDPKKSGEEHYEMYGGRYNKSLCHAWSSSPVYLLGRYALGVYPTDVAYKAFEVRPNAMCFGNIKGKVPVADGYVEVEASKESVTVISTKEGGTLLIGNNKYAIEKNVPLTVKLI